LSHRVRYALRASAAVQSMRRSSEGLARAQRLAGMGNWFVLSDGTLECSAELLRIYGATETDPPPIDTGELLARVCEVDRARVRLARARLVDAGEPYQIEFAVQRYDGAMRSVFEQAAPVTSKPGRGAEFEGITQDITERVQAQERIRQLAHFDATTGLPNRQFFTDLAGPSIELARRHGSMCAVLHVDVDRFKSVNDALGRVHGDAVLVELAERMRECIRASDLASLHAAGPATPCAQGTLARVGANAFTLLITDLAAQGHAALVAQRLLDAVGKPFEVASQRLVLTASIGIAIFPDDAQDMPRLTRCAEQAVYAAKAAGRAQHRFFNAAMNEQAMDRLQMEADLRRAIVQGELVLHFQPKVDAASGAIVGAEALVRWQHPERGMVPPMAFIPLAEETGLVVPLTDWVLEAVCRTSRGWRDAGLRSLPLSVNLAATCLVDMVLVDKLDLLIARFGLSPTDLILEMTETMLMVDVQAGIALLQALRARGYGLSLDDFGTGYSSLSYLKRFPMDELKIDRTFVTDAARGSRDGALAAAIIALGREMGLRVVAEGVETPEQKRFLLGHGCSEQQGFLYSRPLPTGEFARLLRAGTSLPPREGAPRPTPHRAPGAPRLADDAR